MKIHIQPTSYLIRVYEDNNSYEDLEPYALVISVSVIDDNMCYLYGARGNIDRQVFKQVMNKLKALGFKKYMMKRGDKLITRTIKQF